MSNAIRLHFTKGRDKVDRLDVERRDGSRETIDCPKQRIIPHDMVHFAVESELTQNGFLSRVAAGEQATFTMTAKDESDGVERLVEIFQGDGWSGGESSPDTLIDLYAVTCKARGCTPLPIDSGTIAAIRTRIVALDARWRAIAPGETLTLAFCR